MATTYVARTATGFDTRSSETMAYTHACVLGGTAYSWHTSEANAVKAAVDHARDNRLVQVVPVERHEGTKATVTKRLLAEAATELAAQRSQELVDKRAERRAAQAEQVEADRKDRTARRQARTAVQSDAALAEQITSAADPQAEFVNVAAQILSGALGVEVVETTAAPAQAAPQEAPKALTQASAKGKAPKAQKGTGKASTAATAKAASKAPATRSAGARAVPTQAANKKRQAHLTSVGIDKYRSQYNAGWDAATYGQGAKRAASGTASVAWMDGYTDRTANPGKDGIAAKWSALRSTAAPVKAVKA